MPWNMARKPSPVRLPSLPSKNPAAEPSLFGSDMKSFCFAVTCAWSSAEAVSVFVHAWSESSSGPYCLACGELGSPNSPRCQFEKTTLSYKRIRQHVALRVDLVVR